MQPRYTVVRYNFVLPSAIRESGVPNIHGAYIALVNSNAINKITQHLLNINDLLSFHTSKPPQNTTFYDQQTEYNTTIIELQYIIIVFQYIFIVIRDCPNFY